MSEQLGLFGPIAPVPVVEPAKVGVRWSRYTGARQQCTHCVRAAHERRGRGALDIRSARERRVSDDGELLLCRDHAAIRRAADERAGLIGKAAKKTPTRRRTREAS